MENAEFEIRDPELGETSSGAAAPPSPCAGKAGEAGRPGAGPYGEERTSAPAGGDALGGPGTTNFGGASGGRPLQEDAGLSAPGAETEARAQTAEAAVL